MSEPSYHQSEEYINRLHKLQEMQQLGIDPYPAKYTPSHLAQSLLAEFKDSSATSEMAEKGESAFAAIAGRLVLFRAMGKNAFAHLQDSSGRLQVMFNREHTLVAGYTGTPELSPLKFIEKKIDLGDIIGIEGHLFRTHKGEVTLYAKKVTVLSKSLLPLADKHGGLSDKETRYRKRWLDLICNDEVKQKFLLRSQIFQLIRTFFAEHAFIEVETPIVQSLYGGAQARPFTTELNALNQQMYLRIALEIALKKLIIGGMERVFEIGKVFRNEGMDRNHNPEFTMMEAYAAYWDYEDMMRFTENLFEMIALKLYGKTTIACTAEEGKEPIMLDLKAPWKRMTMKESILTYAQVDCDALSELELAELLAKENILDLAKGKKLPKGLLIAELFGAKVEPHLIQPHHIIDHPIETTPLCKLHRNPKERQLGIIERFESFILGQEICNAYSELNDPVLQRQLLTEQAVKREEGDLEAAPLDEEFIEAICQGMPPTGGLGIGLDRLVMILTNSHSIRDVLFFPWMKPLSKEAQESHDANS